MNGKYHREVWFEEGVEQRVKSALGSIIAPRFEYSQHARLATVRDRYGLIPVLSPKDIARAELFEYVREGGEIVKAVFRVKHLSDRYDYSYSLSLAGTVVTCWANEKTDVHSTLDASLYERRPS